VAPFTFNLQPVLEVRERIEDERKRDYAGGLAEHRVVLRRLESAEAELQASLTRLRSNQTRRDPRAFEDAFAEVAYLRELRQVARQRVQESEVRLQQLREALLAATKDKNVMEKLKERRRLAYYEARRLLEEQEIDDANVIRTSNNVTLRRENEDLELSSQ
jgi:flagellar export protein FliJ